MIVIASVDYKKIMLDLFASRETFFRYASYGFYLQTNFDIYC